MVSEDPGALIYQPNLTCTYIPTWTGDHRMRILTVINKDPAGINDAQICSSLWTFIQNFHERLKTKSDKPDKLYLPQAQGYLAFGEKRHSYSVVMVSEAEDIVLGDFEYFHLLQNFCLSMAQKLGVELEGQYAN